MGIQIPQRVSGSFQLPARKPQTPDAPAGTGDPFAAYEYTPADVTALIAKYTAGMPAPLTPQQIHQQISGYVNALPKPQTGSQISQAARAQINPQISALTSAITGQTQAADQAIQGYTSNLQQMLTGTDFTAPYTGAEQQQAAVDAALQSALQGGGSAAASDLSARLASIGSPDVTGAAADAVAKTGTGNANTQLANGSAALSALINDAASAGAYGKKLPGIAGAQGAQLVANQQGAAQQTLATDTAQIEQQLPNILQALQSSSDTNASNRAQLAAQIRQFLTGESDTNAANRQKAATDLFTTLTGNGLTAATADAGLLGNEAKAGAPQRFSAGGVEYTLDPTTGAVTQLTPGAPTKPVSVSPGTTLVDPNTGKPIYTAPPKPGGAGKATGGLSASSWRTLVSGATTRVTDGLKATPPSQRFVTVTKPDGTKVGKWIKEPGTGTDAVQYQTALQTALAMGPNTPAWQKKATQIVNAQYTMGDNGRPYEGKQAVTVARQFAAAALKSGITQQEALQRGRAVATIPDSALIPALHQIYNRHTSSYVGLTGAGK